MNDRANIRPPGKLRAIIVDDEQHARENLGSLLAEYCPQVELAGEAADPDMARQLIEKLHPDLLFLDIRLSGSTGFDLLASMDLRSFGIIFVTAYDNYAIRAIRFSAVDYLLKPIDPLELKEAVRKYAWKKTEERKSFQMELLIENLSKDSAFHRLAVNTEDRTELLVVKSILRLQGESNYTRIFLEGGSSILVSKTLVEFEDLLSDLGFLRVHKTHLVNTAHVTSILKQKEMKLIMTDGSSLPVSRRRKHDVGRVLNRLHG